MNSSSPHINLEWIFGARILQCVLCVRNLEVFDTKYDVRPQRAVLNGPNFAKGIRRAMHHLLQILAVELGAGAVESDHKENLTIKARRLRVSKAGLALCIDILLMIRVHDGPIGIGETRLLVSNRRGPEIIEQAEQDSGDTIDVLENLEVSHLVFPLALPDGSAHFWSWRAT